MDEKNNRQENIYPIVAHSVDGWLAEFLLHLLPNTVNKAKLISVRLGKLRDKKLFKGTC